MLTRKFIDFMYLITSANKSTLCVFTPSIRTYIGKGNAFIYVSNSSDESSSLDLLDITIFRIIFIVLKVKKLDVVKS